jgi:hypothetical protein
VTSKNKSRNDVEEEQESCQEKTKGRMSLKSKNGVEEEQEEERCQRGT